MAKNNKSIWKSFFELGKEDFYRSNYSSAFNYFKNALLSDIRNPNNYCLIYMYCAALNYYLGDDNHMLSINYLNHGLIEDNHRRPPLWLLIDYLYEKNDIKQLKDLNNLLKIFEKIYAKYGQKYFQFEEFINIYRMQGCIYRLVNQNRLSLRQYTKAISLLNNESLEKGLRNRLLRTVLASRSSTNIERGNFLEAINDINNSILLNEPNHKWYFPYMKAALIYEKLQNYNISISMFSQAINSFQYSNPEESFYVLIYMRRGCLKIKNGNIDEAINDFELAFAKNKNCFNDYRKNINKIPKEIKKIISIYLNIEL